MLLAIPSYVLREPWLAAVFSQLRSILPRDTHFVILTNLSAGEKVSAWFRHSGHTRCRRCRIIAIDDRIEFSMWAEDAYAVGRTAARRRVLIRPLGSDRRGGALISELLAEETGMECVQSSIAFQGGNLLVGDTFCFVGADDRHEDRPRSGERGGATTVSSRFVDDTRTVLYVGCAKALPEERTRTVRLRSAGKSNTRTEHIFRGNRRGTLQPLFHIDMFVTLAGRERDGRFRVLVGDPRLAADIAGLRLPSHAMVDAFDEVADCLSSTGMFSVSRNPLPYVYRDVERTNERWWYFASANNALVECRNLQDRSVWLPTYAHGRWAKLRATDEANQAIWRSLGYTVHPLPNFHMFAENLGAVHCLKKYLAR